MINAERRERAVQNVMEAMRNVLGPSANVAEIETLAREYESKVLSQAKSIEEYYAKIEQKLSSLRKKKPPAVASAAPTNPQAQNQQPVGSATSSSLQTTTVINSVPVNLPSRLIVSVDPGGSTSSSGPPQIQADSPAIDSNSDTAKLFLVI